MKANYFIGIVSALLLASTTVKAQNNDMTDFRNNDAKIVNNYYDDYDYYFSSRINRFHRSYAAFDYYSPVFTDTYFYNYLPYSSGLSIYGGSGFGLGFSFNYPFYNYDYGYYNGYNPYFGSSFYWGYDPFFYNNWFFPLIINFNLRNRWHNDYYGWNGHNRDFNNYRPGRSGNNNFNNYRSDRYVTQGNPSRRSSSYNREYSSGNVSGREGSSRNFSRNAVERNRLTERSGRGIQTNQTRRNANLPVNRRVEQQAPTERRSSVSSVSRSNTSRTMNNPARGLKSSRSVSNSSRSSSSYKSGNSVSSGRSSSSGSRSRSSSSGNKSSRRR